MADGDGEEKVGIIRACFRFLRFWNWRKARAIVRAADNQFTGSAGGIRDAFDIQQDKMIGDYKQLESAVAEVETVTEEKRQKLHDLNDREHELIQMRDGALRLAEAIQDKTDDESKEKFQKYSADYARFEASIQEVEAEQARYETDIKALDASMKKHMSRLRDMQVEIKKMPEQKATAIAEFVSSNKIIQLNNRLNGLQTSMDRGPIDAVLKRNRELTAQAKISDKIAGVDVAMDEKEYKTAAAVSAGQDKLSQVLAARKAAKDAQTAPVKTEDRPKI